MLAPTIGAFNLEDAGKAADAVGRRISDAVRRASASATSILPVVASQSVGTRTDSRRRSSRKRQFDTILIPERTLLAQKFANESLKIIDSAYSEAWAGFNAKFGFGASQQASAYDEFFISLRQQRQSMKTDEMEIFDKLWGYAIYELISQMHL